MKKVIVFTALLMAALNLTSCDKKETNTEPQPVGDAVETPVDSVPQTEIDSATTGAAATPGQASDVPAETAQPANAN